MVFGRFSLKNLVCLIVVITLIFVFHLTKNGQNYSTDYYGISTRLQFFRENDSDNVQAEILKIIVLNEDPLHQENVTKKQNKDSECKIPKLNMLNPEIMKSYKKPKPINCDKYPKNWLYIDENGILQATEYAKNKYGEDEINCIGNYFERQTDNVLKYHVVTETIKVGYHVDRSDYLKLNCSSGDDKWSYLFMTIAPKQNLIEKAYNTKRSDDWSGLSVYWFSLDSLSQMAYRRSLPKTVEYLEKNDFIVLNGYNIVGDGTPQAFIPILTGKTELELPLTRKRYPNAKFVDVYPFIWNNFTDLGYITMYGEDAAEIGTFTYRLKGFKKQPTDHYTRTFFMLSEKFFPRYSKCFGEESQYKAWLRYIKEFFIKYPKEIPKFAMMHHSDLTHDDVTLVQNADDDIKNHFEELIESNALDDTVVFIGADHGHRFASFRQTQQGQQEERLPFMAIRIPKKFRETEKGQKIFKNLKNNAEKLTTPFDIYSTFEDILHLPEDLDTIQDIKQRSLSLFRPIPDERTCAQAGVEPHWCTCLAWQNGDKNIAEKLSKAVVQTINKYTSKERKLCAPLKLHQVVESKALIPDEKLLKYGGNADPDGFIAKFTGNAQISEYIYMIIFTTVPGNARYEATVQYDNKKDEITIDMLSISHVNKYGDAPHCIIDKNYFLATYCVCYDKIEGI